MSLSTWPARLQVAHGLVVEAVQHARELRDRVLRADLRELQQRHHLESRARGRGGAYHVSATLWIR